MIRRILSTLAVLLALGVIVEAALVGSSNVAEGNTSRIDCDRPGDQHRGNADCRRRRSLQRWQFAEVANVTSSLAGTYTKVGDEAVASGSDRVGFGLTYNIGGTRGATHTLSVASTPAANQGKSGSWQEFDSIAASPTVTKGTAATATSNTPSCSVTVPSGTATVVGIMIYFGASATATVTDGTRISEADENSDFQAHFIAAKFGASGSTSIAWQFGAAASRQWHSYCASFEEAGGGGGGRPRARTAFS
jgi:hypothetical protein